MGLTRIATSFATLGLVSPRSAKARTALNTKRTVAELHKQTGLQREQLDLQRLAAGLPTAAEERAQRQADRKAARAARPPRRTITQQLTERPGIEGWLWIAISVIAVASVFVHPIALAVTVPAAAYLYRCRRNAAKARRVAAIDDTQPINLAATVTGRHRAV